MTERQTGVAFVATTLGLLALIAAQDKQPDGRSALAHAASRVTSPVASVVLGASQRAEAAWKNYIGLVDARSERDELLERIEWLEVERAQRREIYEENRRLRELLGLPARLDAPQTVVAHVVADLSGGMRRAVRIDRGSEDGIGPGWVAISRGALAGRVVNALPSSSEVMLVDDPDSAVAVRHQFDRFAGMLHGGNRGPALLRYIPRDQQVVVGDPLVTSGLDGMFPPGLTVGYVQELTDTPITWGIGVHLAVDTEALEELLLIPPLDLDDTP